jgi:HK97 family phage major capsid protein
VHEMTAEYYVTRANLQDSAFDLEAILREQFTEQFGVLEGTSIISGSGVKSIQGILTATGYNSVNSGHATTVTADGIIDLKYSLKTGYARSASFILNRSTLKAIRKLKDGEGQYLWQAGLADARPNTIDGDNYVEMPDMPSLGAGNKAMAYGDWKRAFVLVDRTGITMMRDDFTRASVGQVKLLAHRRLGGQVVLAESYSVMTTSA